jgi:prevent-host-death family protein
MTIVTVHAAKTHLSKLLERVEKGEEIVIARRDKPVARLVRANAQVPARKYGAMKGQGRLTAAFFEPLPPEELEGWE